MDSITPNYYAVGIRNDEYTLVGHKFEAIPMDAVGVWSIDNDNPLMYIDSLSDNHTFSIAEKTDTTMHLVAKATSARADANYLGGIVSPDGQTIYWVNDTKPLP